jgi:hypothetical protein
VLLHGGRGAEAAEWGVEIGFGQFLVCNFRPNWVSAIRAISVAKKDFAKSSRQALPNLIATPEVLFVYFVPST